MPQDDGQQGYTVKQAADRLYSGLKNPDPKFNDLRKIANQLKQQGNGKISDRDFVLHAREAVPAIKKLNILDLTEAPPESSSKMAATAKSAVQSASEDPEVKKRVKALGGVLQTAKEAIQSDPIVATSTAAAAHPLTPISEQILGPGRNLEAAVRRGNERGLAGIPTGTPRALTALPRFAQELIAQGAATIDQFQTPAGMAAIVLGATPIGGFLGKAMPWIQKLAATTAAGKKSWDVAEGLAKTVSDVGTLGLSLVGVKAGRPGSSEPAAAAPVKPGSAPPPLPPGKELATIPQSNPPGAATYLWGIMPGTRGELGPGEQTQYGPKTADQPGQFTNQKATKVAQKHGVKPDDVLQMSRQSNEDLKNATNQLIHLRAQIHASEGSAAYIEQLTNHINAMTEILLERDRVPTAAPPR